MKTTSLLSLTAALALASMVASIGCTQPMVQDFETDEDDDSSEVTTSKKKSSTKKSSATDDEGDTSSNTDTTTPPPADPGTPPVDPGTPPSDPMACFDQCAATGPAAQYWSCSESCQDQQCDDNCWFQSCGGAQEDACIQALDTCNDQCGNPFGPNQ